MAARTGVIGARTRGGDAGVKKRRSGYGDQDRRWSHFCKKYSRPSTGMNSNRTPDAEAKAARFAFPISSNSPKAYASRSGENRAAASFIVIQPGSSSGNILN